MKDIGKLLEEKRIQNGISIEEASDDLDIEASVLENMEAGNVRAFKDMYILKELIKDYAKYLGCDVNQLMEEFNDFLFEFTSKISLEEIESLNTELSEEKKIFSPYTKLPKPKRNYKKFIFSIIGVLILILIATLIVNYFTRPEVVNRELKCMEEYYEFA